MSRSSASGAVTQKRSIGRGASLASASEVATIAAGGLTTIVIARSLGPAGTGVYSIVFVLLAGLQTCSTLGIEVALLYFVGNGAWAAGDALRQTQIAALGLGACGMALGVTLDLVSGDTVFRHVEFWLLAVGIASLPFLLSSTFTAYVVLARGEYGAYALTAAGRSIMVLVLVSIAAPTIGVDGAIVAAALGYPLSAVGILAWARRRVGEPSPRWLRECAHALRRGAGFGLRVNLTNIMSFLNQRADLLILSAYASSASVGRYAIAVAIVNLGWLLPRNLGMVVFPRAVAGTASDDQLNLPLVDRSVRHGIALAGLSAPVVALGLLAIPIVYSSRFEQATLLGLILIPGIAAYGLANLLLMGVAAAGRPDYALYTALIVTPATLALYFVLIPNWGAVGAAVASTISYTSSALLLLIWFRRATGPRIASRLIPGREERDDYRRIIERALALVRRSSPSSTSP